MRKIIAGVVIAAVVTGCGRPATVDTAAPQLSPAPPPATANSLPAGTILEIRLDQPVGTTHSEVGDRFTATVDVPIVAQNGQTAVPAGAKIHGTVTGLSPSASPGSPAAIRLHFDGLMAHGQMHQMSANIVEADVQVDDGDQVGRAVEHAAAGAAAGAILGTILRGDLRAAIPGALLGAGVGTVISLGTAEADANLPAGSRMTIQTTQQVQLH
jgi:hypothetical protein